MSLAKVSSRLSITGLVVLMALDVVLVGLALRPTQARSVDKSAESSASIDPTAAPGGPSPSTPSTPSGTSPTTAAGVATTPAAALAAPLRTMLVAIDDQRAWRATVGSCAAGGATLVTTNNGGKTWVDAKAPLRTIVRVRPTDGLAAFVIGADTSCAAEFKSTLDGGSTWGSATDVGLAWFRDPKNPTAVGAPGSSTSRPCGKREVLDLAVLSADTARVLCADGLVRSTKDTGASWTDSGKAIGAVALGVLSAKPAQTYVALLDAPGCAGVLVRRVDQRVGTSCIATVAPHGPGQVALSLVDGGGWLTVGDKTMRSTDALVTWRVS